MRAAFGNMGLIHSHPTNGSACVRAANEFFSRPEPACGGYSGLDVVNIPANPNAFPGVNVFLTTPSDRLRKFTIGRDSLRGEGNDISNLYGCDT